MDSINVDVFKKVRGVLLDMTGVLLESGASSPIVGSVEALQRLKDCGLPFRIVTNETVIDRHRLVQRLHSLGFVNIRPSDVFAPASLAVKILKQREWRPHLLIHPGLMPEFAEVEASNPNCVVIGDVDEYLTYESLNDAFRVLQSQEKPVILAMGRGKYYKHQGQLTIDLGAFVAALEYACDGTQVEVYGKPAKEFFMSALDDMNITPAEALMIGDDLIHDVEGAQKTGIKGILVKTGKFRPSDCSHPTIKPDAIVDNLETAINILLEKSSFINKCM